MSRSPQSIEPEYGFDHPSTEYSPYNTELTSSPNNIRVRKQSVTFSRKRNFVFNSLYFFFVIILVTFFSVILSRYPLKPELYIQRFYVPAIDKIAPNIETKDKDLVFFGLRFDNRNKLISVSYDSFLNVTIHYLPNTTTSIYFANVTLPGFKQNKGKPFTIIVQTVAPGMSGLLQVQNDYSTMIFRVDLGFSMRFHCRELGKHEHEFQMTAEVEVSMENGSSFEETIQMFEDD